MFKLNQGLTLTEKLELSFPFLLRAEEEAMVNIQFNCNISCVASQGQYIKEKFMFMTDNTKLWGQNYHILFLAWASLIHCSQKTVGLTDGRLNSYNSKKVSKKCQLLMCLIRGFWKSLFKDGL